jgi:hypothetical protein
MPILIEIRHDTNMYGNVIMYWGDRFRKEGLEIWWDRDAKSKPTSQ